MRIGALIPHVFVTENRLHVVVFVTGKNMRMKKDTSTAKKIKQAGMAFMPRSAVSGFISNALLFK